MAAAFSYYGGKQRIASKIVPLLPPHAVYVEPFCGGAAVLFSKGEPTTGNKDDYREVLNDTNGHIVNFYRVLQNRTQCEDLAYRLEHTPYAKAEHAKARALLKGEVAGSQIDLAWAWLTQIQMSFINKLYGGWGRSQSGPSEAKVWQGKRGTIAALQDRLGGVYIDNIDAITCIARWDSPQTLFYCDPPYVGTDQGHYGGYTQADFDALLAALAGLQGSFVLSCYENDGLADYPDWERFEIEAVLSASNSKRRAESNIARTEIAIRCDRSAAMPVKMQQICKRLSQGNLF